jgi:ubiquinol-cytochrome c reductase cytochrome b subunit
MPRRPLSEALRALGRWFEQRLQLGPVFDATLGHRIPGDSASWWYVFGSATLMCFVLQLVTGVALMLLYAPSPVEAYSRIEALNYFHAMGWFVRALHDWGSNFMVAMITLHVVQVFLFGAFKYPRELTWMVGAALFLAVMGMAFTGQVLRFDQDAYWGLQIGVSIMSRIPVVGDELALLVQGGPIVGSATLSRFFALHVFLIPAAIVGLLVVHFRLVFKIGVNERARPDDVIDPATYAEEYEQIIERTGIRFFPDGVWKDLWFSAAVLMAIVACAVFLGPTIPNGPADPALIETSPRPDFFFLSLFAVLALMPPYLEDFVIVVVLPLCVVIFFAIPFIARGPQKHPSRRPGSVIAVVLVLTTLVVLAVEGVRSPWSPDMTAWSGTPAPRHLIEGRSSLERAGAVVLQAKQCRNCHALDGSGGERGPDLGDVATRLTSDQLVRQVLQGGGNMPAYGHHLSPAEVTALVAYLRTLHPPDEPPAHETGRPPGSLRASAFEFPPTAEAHAR